MKQYDDVIELCQIILKQNPKDVWSLNSMGLSLNELNRHSEALDFYEKSLQIEPNDATALMNKAISLTHLKKYEEAIEYYDKTQVADATIKEAPIAKSKLFEKLGMEDEAFLAAQGVLNKNMQKIKDDAKENKCSVFHQFCDNEFVEYDSQS